MFRFDYLNDRIEMIIIYYSKRICQQITLFQVVIENPGLKLKPIGHYTEYSSSNRAGVFNEVAMTALPALISMIPQSLVNDSL